MALPYKYAGAFTRSAGKFSALAKQIKLLNLKPAKRIVFTYDPFGDNVRDIRNVQSFFSQPRVQDTNLKCILKSDIVNTRAEPEIVITLDTGKKLVFKTKNLSDLEVLKLYNQYVSSLFIPEEEAPVIKLTKGQKRK